MTKTALIADDDSTVRGMLGRLLSQFDWNVIEAQDGCAALERLHGHHVDLVLLDQKMPQLSGLEVLQVMRGSAEYADIPVVVVTGAPDPGTSASFVELGISDCLVKPFRLEFVRERLARIDKIVRAMVPTRRRVSAQSREAGVVMLVDGDAEQRAFLSTMLMHRFKVLEAASGVAALRACVVARPTMFLIGTDVGLIQPVFLARKLRERREFADAQLVMVTGAPADEAPAPFDAVLPRTFVPDEFNDAFDRLFGRSFDDDTDVLSSIRRTIESATEQAIGMMASTRLMMSRVDAAALMPFEMQAAVTVTLETERLTFNLALRAQPDHVNVIAGQMLGVTPAEVSEEDALATLSELTNVVAGRVKTSVTSRGDKADFTLPKAESNAEVDPSCPPQVVLQFGPQSQEFQLFVALTMLRRR